MAKGDGCETAVNVDKLPYLVLGSTEEAKADFQEAHGLPLTPGVINAETSSLILSYRPVAPTGVVVPPEVLQDVYEDIGANSDQIEHIKTTLRSV